MQTYCNVLNGIYLHLINIYFYLLHNSFANIDIYVYTNASKLILKMIFGNVSSLYSKRKMPTRFLIRQ